MKIDRIDSDRCRVPLANGRNALLYANQDVFIDRASIDDVCNFSQVADAIQTLKDHDILPPAADLEQVVLTPDFHKGSKMPVGTTALTRDCVLPQAAGNDIGCGMALVTLEIEADQVRALDSRLDTALRHMFFEGGRDVQADAATREAILTAGLPGLNEARAGLLADHNAAAWAMHAHKSGYLGEADGLDALSEWIRPGGRASATHDSTLGTIGGGNHFVELQAVEDIFDGSKAWRWGLKRGQLAIMIHSGSLSLGRAVALRHVERAKAMWPKGVPHPCNGLYVLPIGPGTSGDAYLRDMRAAAHVGMANRAVMALMVAKCLSRVVGRPVGASLIHDLPHNLVWTDGDTAVHRKGSCPAPLDPDDSLYPDGAPVIIPGSMATSSYLLAGQGLSGALSSSPHGAGRAMSRNAGRAKADAPLANIRLVTKIDLTTARRDVAAATLASMAEEAGAVYKDVEPVIQTVIDAGIATKVARMSPILTIKG